MGPSGEVAFPPYIERYHEEIMTSDADDPSFTTDMLKVTNALLAAGANPYENFAIYNPDGDLDNIQTRMDTYNLLVDGMNELSAWEQMLDQVLERIDDIIPTSAEVETDVSAFDENSQDDLARAYNRVTATMRDINAVHGTAFPGVLAMLENKQQNVVASYRAQRNLQASKEKALVVLQSIDEMVRLLGLRVQASGTAVTYQGNVAQTKIAAKVDQIKQDIALTVDESFWDVTVLQQGASIMSAASGAPAGAKAPNLLQSTLSGAFAGASAGVQFGMMTGNLQLGVLTTILGLAGGAWSGMSASRN